MSVSQLPQKYIAVGEVVKIQKDLHKCLIRPKEMKNCTQCSLYRMNCDNIQCSAPDRKSRESVYFKRIINEKESQRFLFFSL
jgi:hypothetical protein